MVEDGKTLSMDDAASGIDYGMLPSLLGFRLRQAQLRVFEDFSRTFREAGIRPGQVGLLELIARNPGLSQSALARAVGVERATLGEALQALLARGWVHRQKSTVDKRAYSLALSPSGKSFLRRVTTGIRRHEDRVAGRLTTAERATLLQLLEKLIGEAG